MSKIFISYRREDSRHVVGRIFDHLSHHFGADHVFKDVDSIPLGKDFRNVIGSSVESCDVVLAVIGDKWLELADEAGKRRLDDPDDFVRIEIEASLNRGIPVIPVLVADAEMPAEKDLPGPLGGLAFQNGLHVRSDPDFTNDVHKLIKSLEGSVGASRQSRRLRGLVVASVLLVSIAALVFAGWPALFGGDAPAAAGDASEFIGALDGIYMGVDENSGNQLSVVWDTNEISLLVRNCEFFGEIVQSEGHWSILAGGQDGMCDWVDAPFVGKEVGTITPFKGKLTNSGRVLKALVNFQIGSMSALSGTYAFAYNDLEELRRAKGFDN
jgi:hypothetical protein